MGKRKNVLIVDDEPDAIEFVKAVLSEVSDFNIIPAEDGEDGINKAKTLKPELIILDVLMPKLDGFQVFYELRADEFTRAIPIIMLTGVADKIGIRFFKEEMKKFLGSEPYDYIEKPLDPLKLKEAVKKVFNIKA